MTKITATTGMEMGRILSTKRGDGLYGSGWSVITLSMLFSINRVLSVFFRDLGAVATADIMHHNRSTLVHITGLE